MTSFPLPGTSEPRVAIPAPSTGFGQWAGSSSAVEQADGSIVLAYRTRGGVNPEDPSATVIARSEDGVRFETIATLDKSRFRAMSMERPALVRSATGWRLYVCCATPGSKHWWIDLLEARSPDELTDADATTVFPGDDVTAVKDPIVRRVDGGWQAWICCHPLDVADAEDRMRSAYATSADGVTWIGTGTSSRPGPGSGTRAARGSRRCCSTAAPPTTGARRRRRTGSSEPGSRRSREGTFAALGDDPISEARYLDVLPLARGGYRIYYEWPLADGSHELRTELIHETT